MLVNSIYKCEKPVSLCRSNNELLLRVIYKCEKPVSLCPSDSKLLVRGIYKCENPVRGTRRFPQSSAHVTSVSNIACARQETEPSCQCKRIIVRENVAISTGKKIDHVALYFSLLPVIFSGILVNF